MKKLFASLLLLFASSVPAEFNYSSYTPQTIIGIVAGIDEVMINSDYFIEGASIKHKVLVKYTGNQREATKKLNTFISYWVKTWGHNPEYLNYFNLELEVEESGKKYWLPIQSSLVEPFEQEVLPEKQVELYIMLLGGYKHHPVFSINEFRAK